MNIESILQRASGLRLRGGVVGKASFVLIAVCVALGATAYSSENPWIDAGSMVTLLVLVAPVLHRLITFADRNPQAALMEGAELLVHQEQQLRFKGGNERLISSESATDALLSDGEPEANLLPDDAADDPANEDRGEPGAR